MVRVASLYSLEPFDFDSSHILNFAHPQFCGSHFTQPRLAWFAFKRLPLEVLRPQSQPKPTSGECTLPFPGTKAQKPIHHSGFTIYVCPKSFNFRAKRDGEKKDKAFSWKASEPTVAWANLLEHVSA